MIRGLDSPIVPILWYYPDGSQCSTKHELISIRDEDGDIIGLKCETSGLEVHSILREVERLQALVPRYVYIAESIFSGKNPWNGRAVYGVCTSVEDALDALSTFAEVGRPLIATQREEDAVDPDLWMVHRPDEMPRWDGALWIHRYPIYKKEEGV